jgi:hypothetical protein
MYSARREPQDHTTGSNDRVEGSILKKMTEQSEPTLRHLSAGGGFDILRFCGSLFKFVKFHTRVPKTGDRGQMSRLSYLASAFANSFAFSGHFGKETQQPFLLHFVESIE